MKKKITALILAAVCLLSGCNESAKRVDGIPAAESTVDEHSHEDGTYSKEIVAPSIGGLNHSNENDTSSKEIIAPSIGGQNHSNGNDTSSKEIVAPSIGGLNHSHEDDGNDTGGNAGGNTGGGGNTTPVKTRTYTSEKTGKVFTIPSEGYAQLASDGGSPITVAAKFESHEPTKNFNYASFFKVDLVDPDGEYISFSLTPKTGSWKTGERLGHSELCNTSQYIFIKCTVAYLGSILSGLSSHNLANYFKDTEFKIIEADSSGKAVKFYFYVEYKVSSSSDSPYHTLEGIANVVRDAGAGSSGGSTGGGIGGGTGGSKCFTCNGTGSKKCTACDGGMVQCRSCNGTGTYYATGQGIMKRCTDCNGRGSKTCTRSGCVGGSISCIDCGGDGIR